MLHSRILWLAEPNNWNFYNNHFLQGLSPPPPLGLARHGSLPGPGPPPRLPEPAFDWIRVGSPLPSNPGDVGWLLPAPSALPDRLTKPADSARRSALNGQSRPGRAASQSREPQPSRTRAGGRTDAKRDKHAEEIEDVVVFCGAVGSGNSLLLLLGDSAESKGRIPFLGRLFWPHRPSPPPPMPVAFLLRQSEDGAVHFGAVVCFPLFGGRLLWGLR